MKRRSSENSPKNSLSQPVTSNEFLKTSGNARTPKFQRVDKNANNCAMSTSMPTDIHKYRDNGNGIDSESPETLPPTQLVSPEEVVEETKPHQIRQCLFPISPQLPIVKLEWEPDKRLLFGRLPDSSVEFNHRNSSSDVMKYVSKKHFFLQVNSALPNKWAVHDVSLNGTIINEKRVGKDQTEFLKNKDEIAIGKKELKVYTYICTDISEDPEIFEKYAIGKELGKGALGIVYKCFDAISGRMHACKVVERKKLSCVTVNEGYTQLEREIDMMRRLSQERHENIVQLHDVFIRHDRVMFVMEYCDLGDLYNKVFNSGKKSPPFSEKEAQHIMEQIMKALTFIHRTGIIHRDLKPDNVFLCSNPESKDNPIVKIGDFGLSRSVSAGHAQTACGTLPYCAPEIIAQGMENYDEKVDCWAAGIILYSMLIGTHPFNYEDANILIKHIRAARFGFPRNYVIPDKPKNLILSLMKKNPMERLSARGALEHPWLRHKPLPQRLDQLRNDELMNQIHGAYGEFFLEYSLQAEYKLLAKQKLPGVYVVPSGRTPLCWNGVIFVRQGLYQGGVFRLALFIPQDFPDGSCPKLVFDPPVYHPLINPNTGELDVARSFSKWRRNVNHIWQVLMHARRVFHKVETDNPLNQEAATLYEKDVDGFKAKISECLVKCKEGLYEQPSTDDPLAITFTDLDDTALHQAKETITNFRWQKNRRWLFQRNFDDEVNWQHCGYSWVQPGSFQIFSQHD